MTFSRPAFRRAVPYILSVIVALTAGVIPLSRLLAQTEAPAHGGGGEAALVLPDLGQCHLPRRHQRTDAPARGPAGVRSRSRIRARDLHAAQEHGGPSLDARSVGADLRDLQDVSADSGQVPADPLGVHRRRGGGVLRQAGHDHRPRDPRRGAWVPDRPRRDHPALQSDRNGGKLRGRLVRYPGQHLRQLACGVREPQGQAVSLLPDSAQGGHEYRHAADQRGAGDHALHPAVRSRRLRRPLLHRLRHRRVARRGGASGGRRHLHQDRRHRRRPDEDRVQDQGRRRA